MASGRRHPGDARVAGRAGPERTLQSPSSRARSGPAVRPLRNGPKSRALLLSGPRRQSDFTCLSPARHFSRSLRRRSRSCCSHAPDLFGRPPLRPFARDVVITRMVFGGLRREHFDGVDELEPMAAQLVEHVTRTGVEFDARGSNGSSVSLPSPNRFHNLVRRRPFLSHPAACRRPDSGVSHTPM